MATDESQDVMTSKCYKFTVVVEPDEDRWHAYVPALMQYAAATWGYIREEALKNIQELVEMVVKELVEDRITIPEQPGDQPQEDSGKVAITVYPA
jgi:predicted RNase H-like HicB family nuclease